MRTDPPAAPGRAIGRGILRLMRGALLYPGRAPATAILLSLAILGSAGCAVRCGPIHTLPPQKLRILAPSPTEYSLRVITGDDHYTDIRVPPDGRVEFDVPISARYCTPYLFGVIKVASPTPLEDRRVIRVMRGDHVARKLSVGDIARLEAGPDGYRVLRLD